MAHTCSAAFDETSAPIPLFARGLIGAIRCYQLFRGNRLSPCRFSPSCSHFAIEAIEVHGVTRGSWLALRRIARCNPFGRFGFDPVPR